MWDNFTARLYGVVGCNSSPFTQSSADVSAKTGSGRRAEMFRIWGKVVPPDRVALPAEARQLALPNSLSPPLPPQASAPFLVVEYSQGKRGSKCNYGGGAGRGGGNLRYLRPFKKTLSHQLRPTFLDIL